MMNRQTKCLATVLLLAIVSVAAGNESFCFDGGMLYLSPGGKVVYRKRVKVALPEGASEQMLMLMPNDMTTAAVHVWPVDSHPKAAVIETSLRPSKALEEIGTPCLELCARFESEIQGVFVYQLAFELRALMWTGSNACRLTKTSAGILSSDIHIANSSRIRFRNASVQVPASGAPATTRPADAVLSSRASSSAATVTSVKEAEVFKLHRKIVIEPLARKTFTVGSWPVLLEEKRRRIETVFTHSPRPPAMMISSQAMWRSVESSHWRVVDLTPNEDDTEPNKIRLFVGEVQFVGLLADSLTYGAANHWTLQNGIVSLYIKDPQPEPWRVQDRFREVYEGKVCMERTSLLLIGRPDKPMTVDIFEPLFRSPTFAIAETSHPYIVTAENYLRFSVRMKPQERKTVSYEVRYGHD